MTKKTLNILIVEDLKVAQTVAENIFQQLNCKTDIAATGGEAFERIISTHYDLIVIDLGLPDMNGFDITETIRHLERNPKHIPIIAITANSSESLASKCKSVGFDDFIVKPLTLESARYMLSKFSGRLHLV